MSGVRSVSYEVYYLQYGRWQIHHRYGSSERDEAIEEAKRLDTQGHFDASCVVREAWSNTTGTASESVIYHSPKLKDKPPVGFITAGQDGGAKESAAAPAAKGGGKSGGGGGGRGGPVASAPEGSAAANAMKDAKKRAAEFNKKQQEEAEARAKEAPPIRKPPEEPVQEEADWADAIPKILLGFFAACIIGTVAGVVAYVGIQQLNVAGVNMGRQVNQVILIGSWISGWALTFVPILRKILSKIRSRGKTSTSQTGAGELPPGMRRVTASDALSKATDALTEQRDIAGSTDVSPALTPDERAAQEAVEALAALDDEARPPPEQVEMREPDADAGNGGAGDAEEEPVETAAAEPSVDGPAALTSALAAMVSQSKQLSGNKLEKDHFLRFGAILFLAGAAESIARQYKVPPKKVTSILADQIETMGVSSSMALGFAANIDEYLLDKRYFEMYSAGRSGAMDAGGDNGIEEAFQNWRSPKSPSGTDPDPATDPKHYDTKPDEKDAHGFVAVLFTDIVNSTAKQQKMGDEWLMNVVRAHNDIIREAINKRGGREIKHTGDGIMASFPAVQPSVEAALSMQDGVARFSQMMPDFAFEICIGISAGEPIHESGDLFGTPVNLAARVLSKASANETAVSSIVREMCRGKYFTFEEIGRFELKGFDEAQPIFRVNDRRKKSRVPAQDQPKQAAAG